MLLRFVSVFLISTASNAFAEDDPKAYYRFETMIEDGVKLPDGTSVDLGIEYFAAPDGTVAYAGLAPFRQNSDGSCEPYINTRGELCECNALGQVVHRRISGGGGTFSVDVVVLPLVNDDGTIDFDVNVSPSFIQDNAKLRVHGFTQGGASPALNAGQMKASQ